MDNYPFLQEGTSFYFNIIEGYQYKVDFHVPEYYLLSPLKIKLYAIDFEFTIESNIKKRDFYNSEVKEKIRITICEIIRYFMKMKKCSIVFICDSYDNLEADRAKIFNEWHSLGKFKEELIERKFNLPELDIYAGLIPKNIYHKIVLLPLLNNPQILTIKADL